MAAVTWGELLDQIGRRAHLSKDKAAERGDLEAAAREGIETVEGEDAWNWQRSAQTLTLAANTYEYAWPDALVRFEALSFHYGGSGLRYVRRPENIDEKLGANWRTDSSRAGTPRYFAEFGRAFWLGPTPSAAFVAANPTVHYWGYVSDLETVDGIDDTATFDQQDATELLLPRRALSCCVQAALPAILHQTDDTDWARMDQRFQRTLQRLRGYNEAVRSEAYLERPDFGRSMRF